MYMQYMCTTHVHVYDTTHYNCCFLSKVYVLKALGAEIVRTPTTAAFNSAGQEITIFLKTILSINVLYSRKKLMLLI